jgi:TolB-like protein/class 3 adenylate cyclase/Flp pilus assembly protein TadD
MRERRKIAAILAADVVGFSRMASANEDRTLARLRVLRADVIDPIIASQNGRVFKRTGDGVLVEFRSVVEAVRCAISMQDAVAERNVGTPEDQRIVFRIGIHLGDVVEESDGDLMGDGVNIAARLEGIAKPGAICMSEDAFRQVRGRLDLAITDLGPIALKNIVEPVRVYALGVYESASKWKPATPLTPAVPRRLTAPALLGSAAFLIVILTGGWYWLTANRPIAVAIGPPAPVSSPIPAQIGHLSLVVMPFANLSNDPSQDYFADGISESLTTDLSRLSGSFVIARNTAFTFKGKNVDIKEIGRELGVRYVLEGSVQRDADRMRVNVQLIDAESGNHLWAERFDKPLADLFQMQDEIVARLANQLGAELTSAEAHRSERASNPDSMDLYFQGLASINKGINVQSMARARGFFERALAVEPENLDALLGEAQVDYTMGAAVLSDDRDARLASAEAKAAKVLSIRPNDAFAHEIMGGVLIENNRADQGVAEFERALALNPSLATAHGLMGLAKIFAGHPEETAAHENEALRLSPRDSFAWLWLHFEGAAKMTMGAEEEAVALFRRSIENNRTSPLTHFFLAATLGNLGKLEEAQVEAKAGLVLDPGFSIGRLRKTGHSGDFLENGLRKAGAPE